MKYRKFRKYNGMHVSVRFTTDSGTELTIIGWLYIYNNSFTIVDCEGGDDEDSILSHFFDMSRIIAISRDQQ